MEILKLRIIANLMYLNFSYFVDTKNFYNYIKSS